MQQCSGMWTKQSAGDVRAVGRRAKDADGVHLRLLLLLTILNVTGPGNPDRTTEFVRIRKKTCGPAWFAALR